jgi:hypothetical protein
MRIVLTMLLASLMLAAAAAPVASGGAPEGAARSHLIWYGFLYGVPVMLGGLLLAGQRWALMAGVMYGTIGLALDIATAVQDATGSDPHQGVLVSSGITGLINLLLIVLAGLEFLHGGSAPTPPTTRPPSLRPPPSA